MRSFILIVIGVALLYVALSGKAVDLFGAILSGKSAVSAGVPSGSSPR